MSDGFVFDWQKCGSDDFLKWMIPTLISGLDSSVMDQLNILTNGWQEVELRVQINGVEVPTDKFVSGIENNMNFFVRKEANRLVASIRRLEELREVMDQADRVLSRRLRDTLADAGVELEDEDF